MEYNELLKEVSQEKIFLDEFYPFKSNMKGLYIDGNIALADELISETERKCILAEELGHHYTSSGNILNQAEVQNRKQEHRARMWAYNRLIGLYGIIDCYKAGCQTIYDMAEHLEVTEEFLSEALESYRRKYGLYKKLNNYVIYFEPNLSVFELI